jgi:hypothetical protein
MENVPNVFMTSGLPFGVCNCIGDVKLISFQKREEFLYLGIMTMDSLVLVTEMLL